MKNPLDSLFGRLVLLTVGLVVLVMLTLIVLVDRDRADLDLHHISTVVLAASVVHEQAPDLSANMASSLGIAYVAADQLALAGCPGGCADTNGLMENALRRLLPPGSHVTLDGDGRLWTQVAGVPYAIVMPHAVVPLRRLITAALVMLAFALALAILFTWQMHRPIRDLINAARAYRTGGTPQPVTPRGPRELRELMTDFNDSIKELAEADQERAIMLASIAHDLRTPVTRMLVRADLLANDKDRAGFLRDTESMSRIITQFLDFAGENQVLAGETSVDEHCRRNYTDTFGEPGGTDALVVLDLQAGPGFTLPSVDVDRILSNLIENAMTYGEPPVLVSTAAHHGRYLLTVRDHGPGVPESKLDHVLRPFVRLDAARGGNAHSGLGLAIVRRLARRHGGTMTVSNAPDGGFVASLTFPDQRHTA